MGTVPPAHRNSDIKMSSGPEHHSQQCVGLAILHDAIPQVRSSSGPSEEEMFPLELTWVFFFFLFFFSRSPAISLGFATFG